MATMLQKKALLRPTRPAPRAISVRAAAWTKVSTTGDIKAAGGRLVVEVGGQRVLLATVGEEVCSTRPTVVSAQQHLSFHK